MAEIENREEEEESVERSVSVIIPTWNAENLIEPLLEILSRQTYLPLEILVVDSGSMDGTVARAGKSPLVRLLSVPHEEFDHGKTRDFALRESRGDFVLFFTQDALPADEYVIENLIRPMEEDPLIAVTTARQLPRSDASHAERLVREFNYPAASRIRSEKDIPQLGIKTFFCSDVCAAYRRRVYEELGGFDYPIKTNEDMFFAAKAVHAGYKIAYVAEANVIHSHNFSLRQQYQRNFIQGYEIERHRGLLGPVSQENEGKKLVKFVSAGLLKKGRVFSFIAFGLDCVARLSGSRAGRKAWKKQAESEEKAE